MTVRLSRALEGTRLLFFYFYRESWGEYSALQLKHAPDPCDSIIASHYLKKGF